MQTIIVIAVIFLIVGIILGRYMESGRTQKVRHQMIHERRNAESEYQSQVKALEKDLKNLKGKLGM